MREKIAHQIVICLAAFGFLSHSHSFDCQNVHFRQKTFSHTNAFAYMPVNMHNICTFLRFNLSAALRIRSFAHGRKMFQISRLCHLLLKVKCNTNTNAHASTDTHKLQNECKPSKATVEESTSAYSLKIITVFSCSFARLPLLVCNFQGPRRGKSHFKRSILDRSIGEWSKSYVHFLDFSFDKFPETKTNKQNRIFNSIRGQHKNLSNIDKQIKRIIKFPPEIKSMRNS